MEDLDIYGADAEVLSLGNDLRLMTWNLGYGALSDNADYFMDGGKSVYSASKERVEENLTGIAKEVDEVNPDFLLFQEVDLSSSRSYFIDELAYISDKSEDPIFNKQYSFATNYVVSYVPFPIPPIGKVFSGITLLSNYEISEATRYQLPCPFKWPVRIVNIKRCLEVCRFDISDSDKELVIINLHLEAYDNGEGKVAQAKMLKDVFLTEVEKGNYVIASGDFNQVFSNIDTSMYPIFPGTWQPGFIDLEEFDNKAVFYTDTTIPTCRSLDRPLDTADNKDPEHFQYYVLDGMLVSNNIEVKAVTTADLGFKCSDHNPVYMDFSLRNE